MTDRGLIQQALDALEKLNKDGWILADFEDEVYAAIEALRARLAQPEPEELAQLEQAMIEAWKPIPQREWQGLTDEEQLEIMKQFGLGQRALFADAIEAKLKEKNT